MDLDSFYDLKIGQVIYYKGEEFKIEYLYNDEGILYTARAGKARICFNESLADFSFEKPKVKKVVKLLAYVCLEGRYASPLYFSKEEPGEQKYIRLPGLDQEIEMDI